MKSVPVNALGHFHLSGPDSGDWVSLAQMLAHIGQAMPPGANAALLQAVKPFTYALCPAAVASDPSIAAMQVPKNGYITLFEQVQMDALRVRNEGISISIQFYRQ